MALDLGALVTTAFSTARSTVPTVPKTVTLSGLVQDATPTYNSAGVRSDGTPFTPVSVSVFWNEAQTSDQNRGIKAGQVTMTVNPADIPAVDPKTVTTVTYGTSTYKVERVSGDVVYQFTLSLQGRGS